MFFSLSTASSWTECCDCNLIYFLSSSCWKLIIQMKMHQSIDNKYTWVQIYRTITILLYFAVLKYCFQVVLLQTECSNSALFLFSEIRLTKNSHFINCNSTVPDLFAPKCMNEQAKRIIPFVSNVAVIRKTDHNRTLTRLSPLHCVRDYPITTDVRLIEECNIY